MKITPHAHTLVCLAIFTTLAACGRSDQLDDPVDDNAWSLDSEHVGSNEYEDPTPRAPAEEVREPTSPAVDDVYEPVKDPSRPIEEEQPVVEEPPALEPNITRCGDAPIWWADDAIHRLDSRVFGWTPDHSALVNGADSFASSWALRRAHDGELMSQWRRDAAIDISSDWRRVLRRDAETRAIEVIDRATNRVLFTSPDEPSIATMSPDGSRVAYVVCGANAAGEYTGTVSIFDVDSGDVLRSRHVEDYTCEWWYDWDTALEFSADSRHLFIPQAHRHLGDGVIEPPVFNILSESPEGDFELTSIELAPLPEDMRFSYQGQFAGVHPAPDSSRVEVVMSDGTHHTISLDSLEITRTGTRGAFTSNWDSYLPPLPNSPIAWTSDMSLVASVNPDGVVEVVDVETGELLFELEGPEIEDQFAPTNAPRMNPPVQIAFSPDDQMILVSFRQGLGVWGCGDVLASSPETGFEAANIEVTATPTQHAHSVEINVDVTGQPRGMFTSYKLLVNDALHQTFDSPEQMIIPLYQPGEYKLEVEVDDGFGSVISEPVTIVIAP